MKLTRHLLTSSYRLAKARVRRLDRTRRHFDRLGCELYDPDAECVGDGNGHTAAEAMALAWVLDALITGPRTALAQQVN